MLNGNDMIILLTDGKIKNIEDKIPNINNLATNTTLNAKINEVKGEIPHIINLAANAFLNTKIKQFTRKMPTITNLATCTALTAVENKIPNVSNLVKKLTITQTLMKLKKNY